MPIPGTLEQAIRHHRAGQREEAERLYREVLTADPHHADVLFLLAGLELESGRADEAALKLQHATELAPNNAAYYTNLGEAYRRLGRHDDALRAFLRAMALQPSMAEPVFNLGVLLEGCGVIDGAIACYEQATERRPDSVQMRDRLALARKRGGADGAAATDASVRMMVLLANGLHAAGATEQALTLMQRALVARPDFAGAHNALGVILSELSRNEEALASFRRAVALNPDAPELLANLATALAADGLMSDAIDLGRRSVAHSPSAARHSNLLFLLPFDPRTTDEGILAEARAYQEAHARRFAAVTSTHRNDPSPERRLRIAYVSPDFCAHVQSLFMVPLLSHHDRNSFEISCYSMVSQPDETTQRLAGYVDRWSNIVGMEQDAAAEAIRADAIDILVDLTMHMANNELLLFARKPAPVQVCWLAYPGTTGLAAMEYRLSDPYLDSPESDCRQYSEKTVRLPDTFWCYDPLATGPEVGPLPALARGQVAFGCLNNFAKVNPDVLELWGRVLRECAGSRLIVLAPAGAARTRVRTALARHGVDGSRVEFVNRCGRADYLAYYRNIDICLDTVPSNGHTTSLDALWMGVPVVTLVGKTVVGRAGLSQAENLGLRELVATTADEYVRIALALARDLDRLGELRAALRGRMSASPLMDAPRFARALESVYRRLWRDWCERAKR
jgi:predicted O-linked N-acetylglucosamine transferase (SPINDLY family)